MRIDITLSDEVLNFYSKEAEKSKRSRKAQIEITLTSFALKEAIDNRGTDNKLIDAARGRDVEIRAYSPLNNPRFKSKNRIK